MIAADKQDARREREEEMGIRDGEKGKETRDLDSIAGVAPEPVNEVARTRTTRFIRWRNGTSPATKWEASFRISAVMK